MSNILGFDSKHLLASEPYITTGEPVWSLIGYPRILNNIYFNPSAIAIDTKRNIIYTACGSKIFSFSESCGWNLLRKVNKTSAFADGVICHLEYYEKTDTIYGIISMFTTKPSKILTGLKGEFSFTLSTRSGDFDVSKLFYHFDDVIFIRSSLVRWTAKSIDGEVSAEAIGWVNPEISGDDSKKFFESTIKTAEMPEGDYTYNKGSYKLRVKRNSPLKKNMRIGCYLLDKYKDFSDLGFIRNITHEDYYDIIEFDYPTKYEYNGSNKRGIIVEFKSPSFSENIFIPKKMDINFSYIPSPYPENPIYVFRRQGYVGIEDALISTMIGQLPMTLDIGFYAFISQSPYDSELSHNSPTSPYYLILRGKRNRYYNLTEKLKLVSERQSDGPNGEFLTGDSKRCILNHSEYGDLLKTEGDVYPIKMNDGSIIACVNYAKKSENSGLSNIKRSVRIIRFYPKHKDSYKKMMLSKTLFSDEGGNIEFTGNPIIKNQILIIPLRRIRKRFIRTNIMIVGVEPISDNEGFPSDYCGHNRASVIIYILGDQRDILKEGTIVRLIDNTGSECEREYILHNIKTTYLKDKYLCGLKRTSSEYLTKAYIVGSKIQYPWDDLREHQEKTKDAFSHPPNIDFNELWDAYIDSEEFRKKYLEGIENEFCSKTIAIFAGYNSDELFILSLNLKTYEKIEIAIPDIEVFDEEYNISQIRGCLLPTITLRNEPTKDSIKLNINSKILDIIDGGEHYKMPIISELNDRAVYIRKLDGDSIQHIILFPNNLYDACAFVSYSYRKKDSYIKNLCLFNGNLYAFEEKSGRFIVFDEDFKILKSERMYNEEEGTYLITAEGDIFTITLPHFLIIKSSTKPSTIVRKVKSEDSVADILYKTLSSFNLIAYVSPNGFLNIRRRGETIGFLN
ncbi:MAG: hypothetical protein ACUVWP_07625 [bacterium]